MKKTAALLILCAMLTLSGCGHRTTPAEQPAVTPPTEENTQTSTPLPATQTPAPTVTPGPTPVPPIWIEGESVNYTLFTGTAPGAGALRDWLQGEGAALIAAYRPEDLDEDMFTLRYTPSENPESIPAAKEDGRYIRMATDKRILDSGLLSALLPVFEERYGYVVEVFSGDAAAVSSWADSAAADVTLLSAEDAATLPRRGFSTVTDLIATVWSLQ